MARTTSKKTRNRPEPGALIEMLLAWYDVHRRTLPWRAPPGTTPDPYHVLVSELMLQQTTVATVRHRFDPFIDRFPSLIALALASEAEVLHAWQGLGYYRRARALHAAARTVVDEHGATLPSDVDRLMSLPGIGAYTAKAIAAIAFDQPVVPVDGNVMRVLSRVFKIETPLPQAVRELEDLAGTFEPCFSPRRYRPGLDGSGRHGVPSEGSALCQLPLVGWLRRACGGHGGNAAEARTEA